MSFLANILNIFTSDLQTIILLLIICSIVYKLVQFYIKVLSLPPGPIPLPLIGNVLDLVETKRHWTFKLEKISEKYGPVFTFWMGTSPVVFISDIHIGQEAFRKNDFAGRPYTIYSRLLCKNNNTDVVLADYGQEWEALRKVAHLAVKKYSTTDKLVYLVSDCVDQTFSIIIEREGLNKPFDPSDYIFNTFIDILVNSAFGMRLEWDDPDFKTIANTTKALFDENYIRFSFWQSFPFLTKIDKKYYRKTENCIKKLIDLIGNQFKSHYKSHNELVIRNICFNIIRAKNDAIREGKASALHLKDENLILVIFDILTAGTVTSTATFKWILFFITYYPEIQKKLRQEIESQIGDRIPTHEDRNTCHYVMAFISETLRLRNIIPTGFIHKAVVDSKIGDYTIPKDTKVSILQGYIMHNEDYWPNGQEFRPERFLEYGKYVTTRPKAYIPFGIGRRVCLGERLAIADIFLFLVRFLQNTVDYELVLHYTGNTLPNPHKPIDLHPKDFKISLNSKSNKF